MGRRLSRGSRGALKESAPLAAQASVGSSGLKACGEGPCRVSPLHGGFLRRSGPAGGRATVQRSCNISRSQKALSEAVGVGRRGKGRCPSPAERMLGQVCPQGSLSRSWPGRGACGPPRSRARGAGSSCARRRRPRALVGTAGLAALLARVP